MAEARASSSLTDGGVTARKSKLEELKSILASKPEAPARQADEASLKEYTDTCEETLNSISSTISALTDTSTSGNRDNEIIKMFISDDNTNVLNINHAVSVPRNISGSNAASNAALSSKTIDSIIKRNVQKALMSHNDNPTPRNSGGGKGRTRNRTSVALMTSREATLSLSISRSSLTAVGIV